MRFIFLLVLFLPGCSMLASHLGAGASTIQLAQAADAGKTAADVAAYLKESRSFTDVAVSRALQRDCKLTRLLANEPYCVDEGVSDE